MKGLDTLIRMRSWELDECSKALVAVQQRQDAIRAKQEALEQEIEAEKRRASGDVEIGMAFAAYYSAAVVRMEQLQSQWTAILPEIEAAQEAMAEAFRNVKQFELVKEKLAERETRELARKEIERMNEVGLNSYRRKMEQ